MLSPTVLRIIIAVALTGHAIAHANALLALVRQATGDVPTTSVVTSWLLPDLSATTAAALAIPFWLISTIGFAAAAATVWGVLGSGWAWREVAIGAAVVSTLGIVLFSAIWPGGEIGLRALHIALALAMNAAILGSQLLLHWPSNAAIAR
jgi:hypothetical protein